MYCLATFGSPHLGYMYNNSKMIDTGIGFAFILRFMVPEDN
jgi:hypothetical protein